jgi:hypothetical protein
MRFVALLGLRLDFLLWIMMGIAFVFGVLFPTPLSSSANPTYNYANHHERKRKKEFELKGVFVAVQDNYAKSFAKCSLF